MSDTGRVPAMTTGPGLAASLAYVSGWLGGIIVLATEKRHRELRFHAAQSILLDLCVFVLAFLGWGIGFVLLVALGALEAGSSASEGAGVAIGMLAFGGLYGLAMIGYLVAKVVCAIKSYRLEHVRLPLLGALAERWVSR